MSPITIDLLDLIKGAFALICALGGVYWALAQVIVKQFNKRLDEKFEAIEKSRAESTHGWQTRFDQMETNLERLGTELSELKRELPEKYHQRDDWIRFSTGLDYKLDRLWDAIREILKGQNAS